MADSTVPTIKVENAAPIEPAQAKKATLGATGATTTRKSHRLLVRIMLNIHGNDYLEHGIKDLDVIGLKDTSSYGIMRTEISTYFLEGFAGGEKADACNGLFLARIDALWDGQHNLSGERTQLLGNNFKDVMKLVKLRKGRDVFLAQFRDEIDPKV